MATLTHTPCTKLAPSENEMDDSDELSMRFFVTDSEVGSIIGLKGENIKTLRNESGARINISDGSSYERIVTVRGGLGHVVQAVYLISTKFETDHLSSNVYDGEDGVSLRLIVPNNNCGSLIGRNGSNIKELREKTGAKIQVANMLLPKSTEREVSLSGPIDKVIECVRKLAIIALETKPTVPHTPYNGIGNDMSYRKSGGGGGGGGGGLLGGVGGVGGKMRGDVRRTSNFEERKAFRPHDINKNIEMGFYDSDFNVGIISEEMTIPNDMVGFIIGKNGNRINEIRQNSGAQIKIVENAVDAEARRFIISGARANVLAAVHAIQTAKARRNRRTVRIANEQEDFD